MSDKLVTDQAFVFTAVVQRSETAGAIAQNDNFYVMFLRCYGYVTLCKKKNID